MPIRLAEAPAEPISLVFRNAKGEEIRTFTSRTPDDPPKAKELAHPGERRLEPLRVGSAARADHEDRGQLTLWRKSRSQGHSCHRRLHGHAEGRRHRAEPAVPVVKPAAVDVSESDLDAQYDLLLRISRQLDRTAKTINRMRDLRSQLDGWPNEPRSATARAR